MLFTVTPVPVPKDRYWFQYLVAFTASLIVVATGMAFGWSSPYVPILLENADSSSPITDANSKWIVATMAIGRFISLIPAVWMMDKYGRKTALLASSIPIMIGYILLAFIPSVLPFIYLARFCFGLSHGAAFSIILPTYLTEIASARIRQSLTIISISLLPKIGICLSYLIAPFVTISTFSYIAFVLPVAFLLTFAWMPESPRFLVAQTQPDRALRSLTQLRRHRDVIREFDEIEARHKARNCEVSAVGIFFSAENRKAVWTLFAIAAATSLTGTEVVQFYSQSIFQTFETAQLAIILNAAFGIALVLTTATAAFTIDRYARHRNQILICTTVGLTICNTILATSFFVNRQKEFGIAQWIPVTATIGYIIFYGFGLATVSHVIIDEILPIDLKTVSNVFFALIVSALSIVTTLLYQIVLEELVFGLFAFCSAAFMVIVWHNLAQPIARNVQ